MCIHNFFGAIKKLFYYSLAFNVSVINLFIFFQTNNAYKPLSLLSEVSIHLISIDGNRKSKVRKS